MNTQPSFKHKRVGSKNEDIAESLKKKFRMEKLKAEVEDSTVIKPLSLSTAVECDRVPQLHICHTTHVRYCSRKSQFAGGEKCVQVGPGDWHNVCSVLAFAQPLSWLITTFWGSVRASAIKKWKF